MQQVYYIPFAHTSKNKHYTAPPKILSHRRHLRQLLDNLLNDGTLRGRKGYAD